MHNKRLLDIYWFLWFKVCYLQIFYSNYKDFLKWQLKTEESVSGWGSVKKIGLATAGIEDGMGTSQGMQADSRS